MKDQTFTAADDVTAIVQMFANELVDRDAPFTIVARLRFSPGVDDRVTHAFATARTTTLNEHGCVAFDMHQHAKDKSSFVIYERWQSIGDLERHLRAPHTVELRRMFEELLAEMPAFTILVPAAAA